MNANPASSADEVTMKQSNRFEQVFAIIRVDEFLGSEVPFHRKVTVKKIMRDANTAEAEVARLNALQKDQGTLYFFQATRLEKQESLVEEASACADRNGQQA